MCQFFIFKYDTKHYLLVMATLVILSTSTVIYYFVEGWIWLDAMYLSFMALTTVSYGDFLPQTDLGKLFTIIYAIVSIGLIYNFINAFYDYRAKKIK